jgi:hypothetical protein
MSDADSTPRRRPPTIDLTAKEVETGAPDAGAKSDTAKSGADAAEQAAAPDASAGRADHNRRSGGVASYALGGIIGAAIVAAIGAGLWIGGIVPASQNAAPPNSAASPGAQSLKAADAEDIAARLDKIQQALQAAHPDAELAGRLATAEAQAKAMGDTLAALTRRVDEIAAASQTAAAQAKDAAAAAEAAKSGVEAAKTSGEAAKTSAEAARTTAEAAKSAAAAGPQRSDVETLRTNIDTVGSGLDALRGNIDALTGRIATLEGAVKSLTAEVAQRTSSSSADDRVTRLTVAAEALRATVERGAPYQAELGAATALGADAKAIATLQPFAALGVPSGAQLGRELAALTQGLNRSTDAEPSSASFLARLENHAQKLVRVTPVGAPAGSGGDDSASVVARIDAAAARGDLAAALAEIAKLPEASRAPLDAWVKKAQAREAAIAASGRIAADALAALSKPAVQ